MNNIPKFKSGWVYTYDKYGIISKRLIRGISLDPFYYQLTGDPNYQWKESEMFLRKKDCIVAMERAGVQHRTLEQATVLQLEEELIDLQHQLKVAERTTKLACDELRNLNYRTFDNADIDFEQQFKKQAEAEINKRSNNDE